MYTAAPLARDSELEQRHLQASFLAEVESDSRYRTLSDGAQQLLLARMGLMNRQGEIWMSQQRAHKLLPALEGGRRSQSGYVSKPTLNKYDLELEKAGLLSWRWSSGKLVGNLRMPRIKVWRIADGIRIKAWARFNAWREQMQRMLRRTFYTAKAKASLTGERGTGQSFRGGWKVPLEDRDNDLRARRAMLWRNRGFKVPLDAETVYPYENEHGNVLYLVVRRAGKRFIHVLPEAVVQCRHELASAA